MEEFKHYIASDCHSTISAEVLDELVARYEWFTAARTARAHLSGKVDSRLSLVALSRVIPLLTQKSIDIDKLQAAINSEAENCEDDLIEKFLQLDSYRIVADEGEESASDNDIRTEAEFDDEDDLVSEELAEVYLSQGLKSDAIAIYRKLSLLNPKKSIYFAELSEQIEKQ